MECRKQRIDVQSSLPLFLELEEVSVSELWEGCSMAGSALEDTEDASVFVGWPAA